MRPRCRPTFGGEAGQLEICRRQRPTRGQVGLLAEQGREQCRGLQADCLQRLVDPRGVLPGRWKLPVLDGSENGTDVFSLWRKGPSVSVGSLAVDRHDPWVFQAAGDVGLEQEAGAADHIVGMPLEELIERHPAMQLLVQSHQDGAEAALACGRRTRNRNPLEVAVPTA